MIPDGFAQVTIGFTTEGPYPVATTFGLDISLSPLDPTETADKISDEILASNLMTYVSDQVTQSSVLVKFGPDDTGPIGLNGESIDGGTTSPMAGPQVSWLIRKTTALGGRANRGRLYFPGVTEDASDGTGVINPATVAAFQADVTSFYEKLVADALLPVVLHRGAGTPTPCTAWVVEGKTATQRRRQRR